MRKLNLLTFSCLLFTPACVCDFYLNFIIVVVIINECTPHTCSADIASTSRIALVKLINDNLMNENIYTTTTSQSSALRMKRWKDKCRRLKPLYFPIHSSPHFNDTFYVHRAHCGKWKNHATTLVACNFKTFCLITKKLSWNFFRRTTHNKMGLKCLHDVKLSSVSEMKVKISLNLSNIVSNIFHKAN